MGTEVWRKISPRWLAPALLILLLWLHGASLGLTDDEAYYWVLAQKPSWGYAFHPPAAPWIIALFQSVLGGILGESSAALVRLPAALIAGGILAIGLAWISRVRQSEPGWMDAAVLVSLAGVFGASWMMVPDLPLFLGWALAFYGTWRLCFEEQSQKSAAPYVWLWAGVLIAVLAKFSGVITAGCAGLGLLLWAPRGVFWRAACGAVVAAILGLVPTLIWNAQNEWQALLYQLRERHSGGFSASRYLRFWLIQMALAGPVLLVFVAVYARRWQEKSARFVWIWALPHALVFCIQPLWAEFKPHWALIVWLPFAFLMALRHERHPRLVRFQLAYGWGAALLAAFLSHVAVFPVSKPTLDVTNDMYGWDRLRSRLDTLPSLPVVGSRYQTASQAAAALHPDYRVTLLPRDLKQLREWPDLGVSDAQGPGWPRLLQPVYFVADNRYGAGPGFRDAHCEQMPPVETFRSGRIAKQIFLWRCEPLR